MNISVPVENSCQFVDVTEISPLISKCVIKVCYVSDEPNRNGSIITKSTAMKIAKGLPGCPIVGFYNKNTEDFEEHNVIISNSNGEWSEESTTFPYGFVDVNPRVWFEKYEEPEGIREYLVTEGYIWTKQFPEAQRVVDKGNNQSMELDPESMNGDWIYNEEGASFFIINDALISKLCILGEDYEPCFEGAQITKATDYAKEESDNTLAVKFNLSPIKDNLNEMLKELKETLEYIKQENKGGNQPVFNKYELKMDNPNFELTMNFLNDNYADKELSVFGFYESEKEKFVVLSNKDNKKFKLNFELGEEDKFEFAKELTEDEAIDSIEDSERQFDLKDLENFGQKKKKEDEENSEETDEEKKDKKSDEDSSEEKDKEEEKKKKAKNSLNDENNSLQKDLDDLKEEYNKLVGKYSKAIEELTSLKEKNASNIKELEDLRDFKLTALRDDKKALIDKFVMLDEEDKKDVNENIDKYSLDDIKAKLAVICLDKRVNFNFNEEKSDQNLSNFSYNTNHTSRSTSKPEWLNKVDEVEKEIKG